MGAYEITLDIHGVGIKLSLPHRAPYDFIRQDLGYFCVEDSPSQLILEASFGFSGLRKEASAGPNSGNAGLEQLSSAATRVSLKEGGIIIDNSYMENGLVVDFSSEQGRYKAGGVCRQGLRSSLKRALSPGLAYNHGLLNAIKRFVIHYPSFFLLERKSNIYFTQACCLSRKDDGFVFFGLPGAGKTTILSQLLPVGGFNFLSDNFMLFDRDWVYAFPESFRVRDRLSFEARGAISESSVEGYYRTGKESVQPKARIKKFFLLQQGQDDGLKPISAAEAFRLVSAMEMVMKEMRDYSYYGLLDARNYDSSASRQEVLKQILSKAECAILTVKKGVPNKEFFLSVIGG